MDHRSAVFEDPDPGLQKLPVARARGPAYPGYVNGGRREDSHVDAVARRGHQRLGEDRQGEKVGVGYPESFLHPGRDQLQHSQRAHPARFLDDQARGRLSRRLNVLRVGALVVGQLLDQLAPQAGEGAVDVGHDRSPHADRGVPVGQPRLGGADHPAVGDAHAARRGVLAVHGEQLPVVAPNNTKRRSRRGRVDSLDLHARIPHAIPEGAGYVHATEPVVEHPHAYALSRLGGQGLGEPVADLVVGDDVVVEVYPTLSPRDGLEPVVVGVGAVLQQREPVSLSQRRVADSPQNPLQTGAARGGVFRYVQFLAAGLSILGQDKSSLSFRYGLQWTCASILAPLTFMQALCSPLAHHPYPLGAHLQR